MSILSRKDEAAYEALGILSVLQHHGDLPSYAREIVADVLKKADGNAERSRDAAAIATECLAKAQDKSRAA